MAELIPRDIATNYKVFPVSRLGNRLYLAMADPLNVLAVDDVKRMTKLEVLPAHRFGEGHPGPLANLDTSRTASMEDIIQNRTKQAEAEADAESLEVAQEAAEATDLAQLAASSEEAPVIKLANLILVQAIKDRASDIHIEPFENMVRLRYRIDGALGGHAAAAQKLAGRPDLAHQSHEQPGHRRTAPSPGRAHAGPGGRARH